MPDRKALIIATLAAALLSIWIYGAGVLSPTAYAWMLHGDPAQHLVGAMHFFSQPWQWPPGAMAISGNAHSSIVFVDAIPLLAIVAKAISWPVHWQYFGLWMLFCHIGMAWCAAHLLARLGLAPLSTALGAIFFIVSPSLLIRVYGHEALMAQWIILWAMWLSLNQWRILPWLALVAVSLLIHPYLGAMGLVFALATCLSRSGVVMQPMRTVLSVATILCSALAVMWFAGYFVGSSEISAAGFGFYSANLLTWIDPMDWMDFLRFHARPADGAAEWSQFFASSGQTTRGQYEGFAYLGAGVIALGLMAVAILSIPAQRKILLVDLANNESVVRAFCALGIVAVLMSIFAVSSTVTLGPRVLFEFSMPAGLSYLAGVFRASGRFIWPLTYLLLVVVIVVIGRHRWGWRVLLVALLIQAADLGPKLLELHRRFHESGERMVGGAISPQWKRLFRHCPGLVVVGDVSNQGLWAAPAVAAIANGAQVDPVSAARPSEAELQARLARMGEMIQRQNWAPQTLYLLLAEQGTAGGMIRELIDNAASKTPEMRLRQIDGYHVLYSKSCE